MKVELAELSTEARDLLRAAAGNEGNLALFRRSDTGAAVRAKNKVFFDKQDPGVAERYVGALRGLVELLLVKARTSEQYELTNHGWQFASKVR